MSEWFRNAQYIQQQMIVNIELYIYCACSNIAMGRLVKFLKFSYVDQMKNKLYNFPRHCESFV